MTEHVTSLSADALVSKAQECFALGLISEATLEVVTRRAYTEPGYDACLELPLDFQIEDERALRRAAERHARKPLWQRLVARWVRS